MPFVCVALSESSCESQPDPVPTVTLKKIPAVGVSTSEENSKKSRLRDALCQREKVWQSLFNAQRTVSRQRQPSLVWLTGVRNDLWIAYAKFNDFHNQVISLVPDDAINEQANVYQSFEKVFLEVASSIEEMKLDIQRTKPEDLVSESMNKNSSISTDLVASSSLNWNFRSSSTPLESVPVPSIEPIVFQAQKPKPLAADEPSYRSFRDCQFSVPTNDSRKRENPLMPVPSKKLYATYERPSFCKSVPCQRRDAVSDVHNRTQTQKSSAKLTELSAVVPGKSTATSEDVATEACLKSITPALVECPNRPDNLTVGLPASEQELDRRDEEISGCFPEDSSAKDEVPSLANLDQRLADADGFSEKIYISGARSKPPHTAEEPAPVKANSPEVIPVSQDGDPIGKKDPLLSQVVEAPDRMDQLYVTPSEGQTRNSCVNRAILRNHTTQSRITEVTIQSICEVIRERELQPPVCDIDLKTSRSCVPISYRASVLTSDKLIKTDTDGRCPPRRIASFYTPYLAVCITLKLFVASSLEITCRINATNQSTCKDKRKPTRSRIVHPPLKNSNNSDHSRDQTSHEFHKPRKKQALEAPYALILKYHSIGPPSIHWIDREKPSDTYETAKVLAEYHSIARILTRPWDPGTNLPTSAIIIVYIIIC